MKNAICIALCILLLFSLAACGAKKAETLLPDGLQFGESYDECAKKHDMPVLAPADANAGYACSQDYSVADGILNGFSWSEEISSAATFFIPMAAYSFNEKKELYEYYVFLSPSTEGEAEDAFNELTDYFTEKLGVEPEIYEDSSELSAEFTTDTLQTAVVYIPDGNTTFYFVIHSTEYELS